MTTLLISEIFPPKTGGSGRWFWELYRRFPTHNTFIAVGEHAGHEEFDRSHQLRIARLPLSLPSWGVMKWRELSGYVRPIRALRKIIRANEVTQIHCGRMLPEGLMALALRKWTGVPYICYVHGEELNYPHFSRELTFLTRHVVRGASGFIANSQNTARKLKAEWKIDDERVHVLNPGVDTRRFCPRDVDPVVRARLGWGDRKVVLTVARLQKRKGHDTMIAALSAIRERHPDVLYAIVGDGEERLSLENQITQAGLRDHVTFHGELGDEGMVECYQQCDLFALPNRQVGEDIEGFGIVLLEAQACGKAVLAGASGGTAEAMRDRITGRVVSCDTAEPLAAAVSELLAEADDLSKMGHAGRKWVVENFDWTALSQKAQQMFWSCTIRDAPVSVTTRSTDVSPARSVQPVVPK